MDLQITSTYANACVEILEIINYMGEVYKKKIPSKLLKFFEENKNFDYEYKLESLNLSNYFLDETLIILAFIEQKYWASDKEQEILSQALRENEKKYQENLREKYNPDQLFKNKISKVETAESSVVMIEYKRSVFRRIIDKIKGIFNK